MSLRRGAQARRGLPLMVLVSVLLGIPGAAAHADQLPTAPPEVPEGGPRGQADHVLRYSPSEHIRQYDHDAHVEYLGEAESQDEDVIVLETDILFGANSWELPGGAASRIGELAAAVPDGAVVEVVGHTDSRPTGEDFDNDELSQRRAQAVADALGQERPDLQLSVEGQGDSEPAVTEDEEDPSTFAANRRVEIRYGD